MSAPPPPQLQVKDAIVASLSAKSVFANPEDKFAVVLFAANQEDLENGLCHPFVRSAIDTIGPDERFRLFVLMASTDVALDKSQAVTIPNCNPPPAKQQLELAKAVLSNQAIVYVVSDLMSSPLDFGQECRESKTRPETMARFIRQLAKTHRVPMAFDLSNSSLNSTERVQEVPIEHGNGQVHFLTLVSIQSSSFHISLNHGVVDEHNLWTLN